MNLTPVVRRTCPHAGMKAGMVALACLVLIWPAWSEGADDLEDLLRQVGEEYARSYSAPFLYAFGPSMNSGMYHTADIPLAGLNFGVNIRAMAAQIHEDDQRFRRVLTDIDLGAFDPDYAGQTGTVVLEGPTIFGDTEEDGTVTGYVDGLPVFEDTAIAGLVDTRLVPMATPEFALGSVYGLKAVVRWLPSIDVGDYGEFKYLGYGLQWNTGQILQALPVDLMVGFAKQKLEVGTLVETNASSFFAAASKSYSVLTGFCGFAVESSDMTISYVFEQEGQEDQDIRFEVDGIQESRLTAGVTLDLGLKITGEVAHGKMTTFSGGLIMGF